MVTTDCREDLEVPATPVAGKVAQAAQAVSRTHLQCLGMAAGPYIRGSTQADCIEESVVFAVQLCLVEW